MDRARLTRLVKAFVMKERQERLVGFLDSARRYPDFLDSLLHDPRYFDPRAIVKVPEKDRTAATVYAMLRALGAGSHAYLVGDCGSFEDGHVGPLLEVLESCVGSETDSLAYSWEANVAYYEGHEGFSYILRNPRARA